MSIWDDINKLGIFPLENAGVLKRTVNPGWICPKCNDKFNGLRIAGDTRMLNLYQCDLCKEKFVPSELIAHHIGSDLHTKEGSDAVILWAHEHFFITPLENKVEVLSDVFKTLDAFTERVKGDLLKWGFPTLDLKLPLLPGCYLLGGLPSMGKTTFALNVATNICEQGKPILYVSYEPTDKMIAVKDLAGYWFRQKWGHHKFPDFVPSVAEILLEQYNDTFGRGDMLAVRAELEKKRDKFYFLAAYEHTAQDLIAQIQPYVDKGVKFIVIDYVQLIKGSDSSKSKREQIDETIHALQNFQSKNNLAILFISAFNRENYREYACLESFKESGGLEYTADAILTLQFDYAKGEERRKLELFQQKKQAQPRTIELVTLKTRLGLDFTDKFAYHSKHETFLESLPATKEQPSEWSKE